MKKYVFLKTTPLEFPQSGYKLHIFGENEYDSRKVMKVTKNTLKKYSVGSKISLEEFFLRTANHKQKGKAQTMYLPISLINDNQLLNFINEIKSDLKRIDYKKDGKIYGDKKIAPSIHYRFSQSVPFKEEGFGIAEFRDTYNPNNGKHNIEGNKELTDFL